MEHHSESFKIYLIAREVEEYAHMVNIQKSHSLDSSYSETKLVEAYQRLREAMYVMGVL